MQEEMILGTPSEDTESQLQHAIAAAIFAVSLLLGVFGNLFFYQNQPGVNVPLYIGLFLLAGFALLSYFARPIVAKNAIFALPALIFAAMLAIFTSPELIFYNGVLMLGCLFLVVRFTMSPSFIGGSWLAPIGAAIQAGFLAWIDGPLTVFINSSAWLRRLEFNSRESQTAAAIFRGLLLTIPILIVFGVLLGSADIVFGDLLSDSFSWLLPKNLDSVVVQLFIIGFFTWVAMSALKLMVMGAFMPIESGTVKPVSIGFPFGLSMIETSMILGSVDVLFSAFVVVQGRYLFGGEANITARGYTYSDYARRGFFELLAVSCMTLVLVLVLEFLTRREGNQKITLFKSLSSALVILTMIILVASFRRMVLYEEAYGFTRLRVETQVFEIWLGLLFLVLLVDLLRAKREFFWIALIVAGFGVVLTLNAINTDSFIASRNIDRYDDTGKLDIGYLLTLSDDAIPVVATLMEDRRLSESERLLLMDGLGNRLYELDQDHENRNALGYHLGKDRARDALEPYRDDLQDFYKPRYEMF